MIFSKQTKKLNKYGQEKKPTFRRTVRHKTVGLIYGDQGKFFDNSTEPCNYCVGKDKNIPSTAKLFVDKRKHGNFNFYAYIGVLYVEYNGSLWRVLSSVFLENGKRQVTLNRGIVLEG